MAEERIPQPAEESTLAFHPRDLAGFPREVRRLVVRRDAQITSTVWLPAYADWIGPLEPEALQRAIDAKEQRRERYQTRVPVVWLLLAVDGFRLSGSFGGIDSALKVTFRCGFGQVYLLDRSGRRVWPVRVST